MKLSLFLPVLPLTLVSAMDESCTVKFKLWDAKSNMEIGYLGDKIDLCHYPYVGISAVPSCDVDKVFLTLMDYEGNVVMKNKEGNAPYQLGDDIDGPPYDVLPLDLYEGKYKIKAVAKTMGMKYTGYAKFEVGYFMCKMGLKKIKQTVDVFVLEDQYAETFPNTISVPGSKATLVRSDFGLSLFLQTENLPKGAYTLWYITYENLDACENNTDQPVGVCDLNDALTDPAATKSAVIRAAHDVVDDTGKLTIVSFLPVDNEVGTDGAMLLSGGMFGKLTDPFNSEVHIVLKYHGLPLPLGDGTSMDSLEQQLHDLQGGCEFYRTTCMEGDDVSTCGADPPFPIELDDGFELCADPQIAIFPAPKM